MKKSRVCPVCGRANHRINDKLEACDGECAEGLKSLRTVSVMCRALRFVSLNITNKQSMGRS